LGSHVGARGGLGDTRASMTVTGRFADRFWVRYVMLAIVLFGAAALVAPVFFVVYALLDAGMI